MHIARIDQINRGQIEADALWNAKMYDDIDDGLSSDSMLYGGSVDKTTFELAYENMRSYQTREGGYAFPIWEDARSDVEAKYGDSGDEEEVFSNTAVNSPLAYLPHLCGFHIARHLDLSAFWTIILMRFCGLALFVVCGVFAIRALPYGRWPCAVVMSMPSTISYVCAVNADATAITAAFLFSAGLFRFLCENSRLRIWHWIALALACLILPICKLAYAPMVGLVVLIPIVNGKMRSPVKIVLLLIFAAVGIVLMLGWFEKINHINTGAMWKAGIHPAWQLSYVLDDPMSFAKLLALSLPFIDATQLTTLGIQGCCCNDYCSGLTWFPIVAFAVATGMTAGEMKPFAKGWKRLVVCITCVIVWCMCVVLVYLALYMSFNIVGSDVIEGVQGRYFIPLALLLAMTVSTLAYRNSSKDSGHNFEVLSMCAVWGMGMCSVGAFAMACALSAGLC